ncbi:MAG: DUF2059 domain-containing protein [Paracoccaceae bacterium]
MFRSIIAIGFWVLAAVPGQAQMSENVDRLAHALGLPEIIQVMRDEGLGYGSDLAENMFPGRNDSAWGQVVIGIYDLDRMAEIALAGFADSIDEADIPMLTAFFESPLGVEIVKLEISARIALMDDAVDAANKANVVQLMANESPRLALLQRFIEVNNLLESNVVGALNSNYAFYTGLVEGGAYEEPISEDQILSDVWEQEADIRQDTSEWLFGFLSMAYSPLSDADMAAYIELSETDAGQALNTALFAGFDEMFVEISHALGLAAARIMASEEL